MTTLYLANSGLIDNAVAKQNGSARLTVSKWHDLLNRLTSVASIPPEQRR